jgi:hypothetical protein
MSEENVESLRDSVAAFNRDDLDAGLPYLDPDVVIRTDPAWPEGSAGIGKRCRSLVL